jgi:hypothetical protein
LDVALSHVTLVASLWTVLVPQVLSHPTTGLVKTYLQEVPEVETTMFALYKSGVPELTMDVHCLLVAVDGKGTYKVKDDRVF